MGLETRHEVGPPVAAGAVVVVHVGGTPAEPLLDDLEPVAEDPLQSAGPPLVGAQPHVLRIVGRPSVGVGVAEAEDPYGAGSVITRGSLGVPLAMSEPRRRKDA